MGAEEQRAMLHMQRAQELLRAHELEFGRPKHPPNASKKTRSNQTREKDIRKQLQRCKSDVDWLQDEVGNESAFSIQTAVSNGVLLNKLEKLANLAFNAGADHNQVQNIINSAISENNKIRLSGVKAGAGKKQVETMVKSAIEESRKLKSAIRESRTFQNAMKESNKI